MTHWMYSVFPQKSWSAGEVKRLNGQWEIYGTDWKIKRIELEHVPTNHWRLSEQQTQTASYQNTS